MLESHNASGQPSDGDPLEDLKQKLSIVLDEQDLLAPVVDDRLTTELTNTVLRCRDIILSTSQEISRRFGRRV